jgi:hypothetical protein
VIEDRPFGGVCIGAPIGTLSALAYGPHREGARTQCSTQPHGYGVLYQDEGEDLCDEHG